MNPESNLSQPQSPLRTSSVQSNKMNPNTTSSSSSSNSSHQSPLLIHKTSSHHRSDSKNGLPHPTQTVPATQAAAPVLVTSVTSLSQLELQDLRRAFILLDTKQEGVISVAQLEQALESLQLSSPSTNSETTHPALRRLQSWKATNSTHSQSTVQQQQQQEQLTFDEFCQLLTSADPLDDRSDLQKVFDLMDPSQKGYLTVHDLHRVAQELGESSMTMEEIQEMVTRGGGGDQDGHVTFAQFEQIMNTRLFEE